MSDRQPFRWISLGLAAVAAFASPEPTAAQPAKKKDLGPEEYLDDPYVAVPIADRATRPAQHWTRGTHTSVQVNVDIGANNILNDAANEPSIAVDPTDPSRMAIGWRQFDTIESNFRQAGWSFTVDGGETWTFPGVIEPGVFRSDPVLDTDAEGNFVYYSLEADFTCDIFRSSDAGATWDSGVFAFGGDKGWMAIDRTDGVGRGNIYTEWWAAGGCCGDDMFNRSIDGGDTFEPPVPISGSPRRGVNTVGPDGEVYVVGHLSASMSDFMIARSTTAQDPGTPLAIDLTAAVDMGGALARAVGPNPAGMLGQVWVATDPGAAAVYVLASIDPPGDDPLDIHFVRSLDGGATWSSPIRVNDDPAGNGAWQWFGTLAVAPNGRLDAVWNDSRNDPGGFDSELFYASSADGGLTWSANEVLTPAFDPHLGWPQQNKIGDYITMVSFDAAAHVAYSATFNGEQDVYYLRIDTGRIFFDGFESGDTSGWSQTQP